jgi:hypothetical protein
VKTVLPILGMAAAFAAGLGAGAKGLVPGLAATAPLADSTATAPDSLAVPVDVGPLQADLARLRSRLQTAEDRADSLRVVVEGHRATAEAGRSDAADLAKTLTKMEDEDLGAVVQRLDGRSFVRLYEAASSRNRARLLNALAPDQAAAFVRHQLPGGAASGPPTRPAAAPADSAASTP